VNLGCLGWERNAGIHALGAVIGLGSRSELQNADFDHPVGLRLDASRLQVEDGERPVEGQVSDHGSPR
jgi:hypothetical protein